MVVALDPSWTPVIAGICYELLERGAPIALEVNFDRAVEILCACKVLTWRISIERLASVLLM